MVNMRLEVTVLTEPARRVLEHLDGTHDRAALMALVRDWVEERTSNEISDNAANTSISYC